MRAKIMNTSPPLWQCKRHNLTEDDAKTNFREGLFDSAVLNEYIKHANSQPYEICSDSFISFV